MTKWKASAPAVLKALGISILLTSVFVGVVLVQQNQELREKASEISNNLCTTSNCPPSSSFDQATPAPLFPSSEDRSREKPQETILKILKSIWDSAVTQLLKLLPKKE